MKKIVMSIKRNILYKKLSKIKNYLLWKSQVFKRRRIKFKKIAYLEKKYGVDFGGLILNVKKLGMKRDSAHGYEASSDMPRIFEKLNVVEGDSIIDIGCGKGYAMYKFSELPFSKIDGLDLNLGLLQIAENNLKILFPNENKYSFYHTNVLDFQNFDDYNYFYLYNPFPERIIAKMFDKIRKSLNDKPRKVFIIYQNPQYGKMFIDSGLFKGICFLDNTALYESI